MKTKFTETKSRREQILQLLKDGEPYYYKDIAAQLNVHEKYVNSVLRRLLNDGVVKRGERTVKVPMVGYFQLRGRKA